MNDTSRDSTASREINTLNFSNVKGAAALLVNGLLGVSRLVWRSITITIPERSEDSSVLTATTELLDDTEIVTYSAELPIILTVELVGLFLRNRHENGEVVL